MTEFLDLRKKATPRVKVIYKTIMQKHPWYFELIKIVAVVVIVGTIVWGVSKADSVQSNKASKIESWSASGLVSTTTDSLFSIVDAHGADNASITSYIFDTSSVQKIENNKHVPLQLSDIEAGDRVVVQGTVLDGVITARRIIFFASTDISTSTIVATTTPEVVATTTATTTDDTTSSTTPQIIPAEATSTDISASTTVATTTLEVIATTTATTTDDTVASTTPEISADITTLSDTTTPEIIPAEASSTQ